MKPNIQKKDYSKIEGKTQSAPFYFRKIDNQYLLTNDLGDFIFLSVDDFKRFADGSLKKNSLLEALNKKNFIKDSLDVGTAVNRYQLRRQVFNQGPSLHVIVVTLRCNFQCVYCHASSVKMDETSFDMDINTARAAVDMIFETTSSAVSIEFQGGEPLANFEIVKFIINYALEKNKKAKKDLRFRLVTNLSLMDEKKLDFLASKKVNICTSLDGPAKLHNKNRFFTGGAPSYQAVIKWLPKIKKKYNQPGYRLDAVATITRYSLDYPKEIVDEYFKLGFRNIFLFRPLNPYGMAQKLWHQIGYSAQEFVDFYKKALDYIIKLNFDGKKFNEKLAVMILQKIFTDQDPNYAELRSPCGAVTGQLAYDWRGNVYTCDEGRMISRMGDESFLVGNVFKNSYQEIINSSVSRSLCLASCLEGLPGCFDCVYKPYCGVCPIFNYIEQGNIFGKAPYSQRCQIFKTIFDYLFKKLKDKKVEKIFRNWVKER